MKKTFTHFTIDFASLFKALDSSITNFSHNDWISEKLVIFLKPVEHQSVYPFDISIFRNKFKNFLDSTINPKEKFYLDKLFHEKPVVLKYGLEVYSILLGYLDFFPKKMAVNNDVSRETYLLFLEDRYRMFHCFYEHRQGLLERLSYVKQQELIGSISDSMIETYHTIVQRLNIICKVYLKVTVKANFLRGKDLISYIATSFASLHNQLREIKEIEEKLLYQRGQISLY